MKVLIAPDSFKGSATATEVTDALADGWRSVRDGDEIVRLPLADGGEGTLDAIAATGRWQWRRTRVTGPDGRPVTARWLLGEDGHAVVELAESSGIALMPRPDPWRAGSRGLGEVILAALAAGASSLSVALGGSASTDGGAGVLMALGLNAFDGVGRPIDDGAIGLGAVTRADLDGLPPLPAGGVELLVDTEAPLYGAHGAAAVFGPQKGATPEDVAGLDRALRRWARVLTASGADADPCRAGAGAAGGIGFGLLAWGARPVSGAHRIGALAGLPQHLRCADLLLTGEGRFDRTSRTGKLVGHVLSAAGDAGVDALVVAGQLAADCPVPAVSLSELAGSTSAAMYDPLHWLATAGAVVARRI